MKNDLRILLEEIAPGKDEAYYSSMSEAFINVFLTWCRRHSDMRTILRLEEEKRR